MRYWLWLGAHWLPLNWSDNYTKGPAVHVPCFYYYSSRPLRCVAGIDYACLREISVDEVFAAVQNQLNANPIAASR